MIWDSVIRLKLELNFTENVKISDGSQKINNEKNEFLEVTLMVKKSTSYKRRHSYKQAIV